MGGDMELVRQFNNELSSICESKPPVSKAKMASITRLAVKALKHYKHIVHSVEKFLQKCRPEYKIAALYVLDSIIRQSRHQFGPDKDLFGPRFQKNLKFLFQNIFQCPQDDKPKVVRVLNLWQKNTIYSPEVISPLIDMASTPSKVLAAAVQRHKSAKAAHNQSLNNENFDDPFEDDDNGECKGGVQMSQEDEIKVLKAQLEQQKKHQELLQQQLQMQVLATRQQNLQFQLQQSQQNLLPSTALSLPQQITPLNPLLNQALNPQLNQALNPQLSILSHIHDLTLQLEKDKATLALLASSEDSVQPNSKQAAESQFLENFQQLIQTAKGFIQKDPRQHSDIGKSSEDNTVNKQQLAQQSSQPLTLQSTQQSILQLPQQPVHQLPQQPVNQLSQQPVHQVTQQPVHQLPQQPAPFDEGDENKKGRKYHHGEDHQSSITAAPKIREEHYSVNEGPPKKKPLIDLYEDQLRKNYEEDDDAMQIDNDDEIHLNESKQHGSRWQAFTEQVQHNQESPKNHGRIESRIENNTRLLLEHRNNMPPPKKNRVTVASITVWVGRLPKNLSIDVVQDAFQQYGEIKSIDYIEARGCAFVTMKSRVEAERALRHLKNKRIGGYDVKMEWGQAKGLQPYSKFWDESFGCAYIPYDLVKEQELPALLEGSIIDEVTLPVGLTLPNDNEEFFESSTETSIPSDMSVPRPFIMPPGPLPLPGMGLPGPGFRGQYPPLHQMLPMPFRPPPQHMIPMQGGGPHINNNPNFHVHDDMPRDPRDLLKQIHPQFQPGMSSHGSMQHCDFGNRPPFHGRPPVPPGEPQRHHMPMAGERFGSQLLPGERPPFERHWFTPENRFNSPRFPQEQPLNSRNFNMHISEQSSNHSGMPMPMQGIPMSVRASLPRPNFNGPVSSWEPRKEQGITQMHCKEQSSLVSEPNMFKNDQDYKVDQVERKPISPDRSRDDRDLRGREVNRNYNERDPHKFEWKEKDRRDDRIDRDGRRDDRRDDRKERDTQRDERGRRDDRQNRNDENRNNRRDRNGRDDFRDDWVKRNDSRERRNHSQDRSLSRPSESLLSGKSPSKNHDNGPDTEFKFKDKKNTTLPPLAFDSHYSKTEKKPRKTNKNYSEFSTDQEVINSKEFFNEQENKDNDGDDLYDPLAVCEVATPPGSIVEPKTIVLCKEVTLADNCIEQKPKPNILKEAVIDVKHLNEDEANIDTGDKHKYLDEIVLNAGDKRIALDETVLDNDDNLFISNKTALDARDKPIVIEENVTDVRDKNIILEETVLDAGNKKNISKETVSGACDEHIAGSIKNGKIVEEKQEELVENNQ
ncbi:SR-related and CTD-associated factor 4 isoform X2 [Hydra vulgaris]|uniref:SR-related and CTD-associated factor 4 isoform X2 n=1 Tax=Hydra vulgaris TaxID=6087 RepID=A0ABM4BJ06_HYDVU